MDKSTGDGAISKDIILQKAVHNPLYDMNVPQNEIIN